MNRLLNVISYISILYMGIYTGWLIELGINLYTVTGSFLGAACIAGAALAKKIYNMEV